MDGKKVVIGSHHFVFEDEGCVIPEGEEEKFDALPEEYSHLFLGVGGVLSAVICVKDPPCVRRPVRSSMAYLGVAGILPPATSALLHNASTLVISLESMTPLLKG